MKILFLTNLLPYPLDNGGKINTYTKIIALNTGGHEVDLLSFKETKADVSFYENHLSRYCTGVYQVYLRLTTAENKGYMGMLALRSLFSRYSFGVYKYKCREMEQLLKRLAKEKKYDCIYYDHLQVYIYEPVAKKLWPDAKEILDEHNCETMIMRRNADFSRNLLKKLFLTIEAAKLKRFECRAIKNADKTVVLSKVDEAALAKQLGEGFSSVIIPNRVAETNKMKKTNEQMDKKFRILFVGTMTWAPNHDGILWFLENVYKEISASDDGRTELYIVGKNPGSRVVELAETLKNVTVTGYVNSVDPYYEMCDCMVVPLFVGSGQRIKIIEAFSRKMPVISTAIGAEGLVYQDGESILIADSAQEFKTAIEKMKDAGLRGRMAEKARNNYEKHYSTNVIGECFNQIFHGL